MRSFKKNFKGTGRNVLPLETQLLRCHQQAACNTHSSVRLRVISSHSKHTAKQGAAFLTCRNYTWIATKFWRALSFSKGFYVISLKPSTQKLLWPNLAFHSRQSSPAPYSATFLSSDSTPIYCKSVSKELDWFFSLIFLRKCMYKAQYSKEDLTFTNVYLNIASMRPLPKVSKQPLFSNKQINVTENTLLLCHCVGDCESPSVCSLDVWGTWHIFPG